MRTLKVIFYRDLIDWNNRLQVTGERFFFHRNLPIKWVRVVGVVVSIDDIPRNAPLRRKYTIDDSSGFCIEVLIKIPPGAAARNTTILKPWGPAQQGGKHDAKQAISDESIKESALFAQCDSIQMCDVLDVKGSLDFYRDEMQITMTKMQIVRGTDREVELWERRSKFRNTVLDQPWVLTEREVKKCLKRAEKMGGEEKKHKKRKMGTTEEAIAAYSGSTLGKKSVENRPDIEEQLGEPDNNGQSSKYNHRSTLGRGETRPTVDLTATEKDDTDVVIRRKAYAPNSSSLKTAVSSEKPQLQETSHNDKEDRSSRYYSSLGRARNKSTIVRQQDEDKPAGKAHKENYSEMLPPDLEITAVKDPAPASQRSGRPRRMRNKGSQQLPEEVEEAEEETDEPPRYSKSSLGSSKSKLKETTSEVDVMANRARYARHSSFPGSQSSLPKEEPPKVSRYYKRSTLGRSN